MTRWLLLGFLSLTGCPGTTPPTSSPAPALVETCVQVGQRCRLSDNKVGICAVGKSGDLVCGDQH